MAKLTAKTITQILEAGRYGDGNGLYLVVSPAGTKSWIQRVQIGGKRTDRGLGGLGKVSLTSARKLVAANLATIKAGKNPFEAGYVAPPVKEVPAIPTFADASRAVYALNLEEWGEGTAKRWLRRLEIPRLPGRWASRDVAEITPLRTGGTADRHLRGRRITKRRGRFGKHWQRFSAGRGRTITAIDDPADDALGELVKKVKHVPEHHRALPYCEVGAAIRKVQFGYAMRVTALAFEFLILTAARTSEVRGMTWDEVDLKNAVWEIPAERMKAKRSHTAYRCLTKLWQSCGKSATFPIPTPTPIRYSNLVEVNGRAHVFRMPTGKPLIRKRPARSLREGQHRRNAARIPNQSFRGLGQG